MSKNYKFWTALLAFVPLVMTAVYFIYLFSFMFRMIPLVDQGQGPLGMEAIRGVFAIGVLMALTSIAGFIFFLIHIVNDNKMDSSQRLGWILIVIFASIIAYPIYWYMKIFKQPGTGSSESQITTQA